MVEWMLSNVICHEFERVVGKSQGKTGKTMHIGFGMRPSRLCKDDQYHVVHMYLFAPMNYVYVATQTERITASGKRVVGPMRILTYHDSCWTSAVQDFIFEHRGDVNVFRSFKLLEWYDIIELTEVERKYLSDAYGWRQDSPSRGKREDCPLPNPFDNRGIWAGKA